MTCIVGLVAGGKVFIGGDSVGIDDWNRVSRVDRKVFRNDGFVMGFTTSYRMGQLLRYSLKPPAVKDGQDLMEYMVVDFVGALRTTLKEGGFAKKENEVEKGGVFLVGFRERLFRIEGDYQVGESADGYDACGWGAMVALGALHATPRAAPRHRLIAALKASEYHSRCVRGPFHIESC